MQAESFCRWRLAIPLRLERSSSAAILSWLDAGRASEGVGPLRHKAGRRGFRMDRVPAAVPWDLQYRLAEHGASPGLQMSEQGKRPGPEGVEPGRHSLKNQKEHQR